MNQRPFLLGCLVVLLGASPASAAEEFKLYDPGASPDIRMSCEAVHYAKGSSQASRPFKLHVEVHFEERYAVLSDGNATNYVRMDLTGVVPTERSRQEYLVLNRGSATAIINTYHHDVLVADPGAKEGGDDTITGKACRIEDVALAIDRIG